jgi:hypothetical protein
MKCRSCNSLNTKVTVTEHKLTETWRYCRCLDCAARYKTIEKYAVLKCGSLPGVPQHVNCRARGEKISSAVLTELNVLEIRKRAADNQTYYEIAKHFGVHKDTIYKIVNRKSWAHV